MLAFLSNESSNTAQPSTYTHSQHTYKHVISTCFNGFGFSRLLLFYYHILASQQLHAECVLYAVATSSISSIFLFFLFLLFQLCEIYCYFYAYSYKCKQQTYLQPQTIAKTNRFLTIALVFRCI